MSSFHADAKKYLTKLYKKHTHLVKYGIIGVAGATIDFVTYTIMVLAGVNPLIASAISTTLGITNNFFLNRSMNFKKKDRTLARFISFYAVGVVGLVLSVAIIFLLHNVMGVNPIVAKIISMPIVVLLQFFMNKHISFGDMIEKPRRAKSEKSVAVSANYPQIWTNILLALAAIVLALFIALATFLTSNCWWEMNQCLTSVNSPVLLFAGAMPIVTILALVATTKKLAIDEKLAKKIVIAVLALVGAVSLFLIMYFNGHVKYSVDMFQIINTVKFPEKGTSYLQFFPYQSGVAMLVRLSFKLFGIDNLSLFYVLNAISVLAIIFGLYRLTLRLTKNNYRVAVVALILAALFTPFYYYLSLVYGDIMGLALALWAILIFLEITRENWLRQSILLAAISIVMIFAKSTFLIVLLALLVAALIIHRGWKTKLSVFAIVVFAIVVAQFANSAFISWYHGKYVAQHETKSLKAIPSTAWIAMGLQAGYIDPRAFNPGGEKFVDKVALAHKIKPSSVTPGVFNNYIFSEVKEKNAQMDANSKKFIVKSLNSMAKDPDYAFNFFRLKLAEEWSDPSFATHLDVNGFSYFIGTFPTDNLTPAWAHAMYTSDISIETYQKFYQFAIYLSAFCALIFLLIAGIRKKVLPVDTKTLSAILLVVDCGFGAFVLWEGCSRFVMAYFILLIPLAALGLELTGRSLRESARRLQKRARHI